MRFWTPIEILAALGVTLVLAGIAIDWIDDGRAPGWAYVVLAFAVVVLGTRLDQRRRQLGRP